MSDKSIIFFLSSAIIFLIAVIVYQRFVFNKGIQMKLKKIGEKLSDILEDDSDEKVMVFTDNKILMSKGTTFHTGERKQNSGGNTV